MGDIGPSRQRYDVLPGEQYGVEDADTWTVPAKNAPEQIPRADSSPDPTPVTSEDQG
jgi:hypothetical protein